MKYLIITIAIAICFLPTAGTDPLKPIDPNNPTPVVVVADTLDTCTATYRVLMAETWTEFSDKRETFKDEAAALEWINGHQTAAYTAAFTPFISKAAVAAKTKEGSAAFGTAIKEHKL